jgi:hypothetical protein
MQKYFCSALTDEHGVPWYYQFFVIVYGLKSAVHALYPYKKSRCAVFVSATRPIISEAFFSRSAAGPIEQCPRRGGGGPGGVGSRSTNTGEHMSVRFYTEFQSLSIDLRVVQNLKGPSHQIRWDWMWLNRPKLGHVMLDFKKLLKIILLF